MRVFTILCLICFVSLRLVAQRTRLNAEQIEKHKLARRTARMNDSILKSQAKWIPRKGIFKFQLASGYANMKQQASSIVFQSNTGLGVDIMMGFKMGKHISLGPGLNVINYAIDNNSLMNSFDELYNQTGYYTNITSYKKSSLTKSAFYLYASYWQYKRKSVLELYGKLALANVQYPIDVIVFRRKDSTHYSEYFSFNQKNNFPGVMPSAGLSYSWRLTRWLYAICAGEYGYYFTDNNFITMSMHNSDGNFYNKNMAIPTPKHFIQFNVGFVLRPNNRIFPYEKYYEEKDYKQIHDRNN